MIVNRTGLRCLALLALLSLGCSSKPPAHTGFLSDYTNLKPADGTAMRFASPELRGYSAFVIDPLRMEGNQSELNPKQQAEVVAYFEESFKKAFAKQGFQVTETAGPGVGRVRVALTGVQESKWYLNIHPASKVTGAGKGGASMEGEVVDSVSGKQLGAVVQAGKGGQFTLNPFSTIEDVKATIDKWTETAAKRLKEIHAA